MASPAAPLHPTLFQSYGERAQLPNTSPLAAHLLQLIALKKTNLCVSADVTSTSELLRLAEEVGDSICLLKTHADIIQDFSYHRTVQALRSIARRKNFLIFEDRKFGDIGSTVQKQYTAGPLTIVRWANIVNCHIFPGPAIITALSAAAADALAVLSSTVTTSISASPAHSVDERDRTPDSDYEDGDEQDASDDTSEEDESPTPFQNELSTTHSATPDRWARKQSVVSVSTTISTKTESISPTLQSNHAHNYDGSSSTNAAHRSASIPTYEGTSDSERATALDRLGAPPFARALLLLAEMSSAGNLMTGEYVAHCVTQARAHADFVMGFIAQRSLNSAPGDNFITMTPGVQIGSAGDGLGQQYNTPEKVIKDAGTDVVIVGRGIYAASDRRQMAEEYRERSWKAYEDRIRRSPK